jgi:hypothetical protein
MIIFKAQRLDNQEWVEGSYLYDSDFDTHRIVISFFEVDEPHTDEQIGVQAPEIDYNTLEMRLNGNLIL